MTWVKWIVGLMALYVIAGIVTYAITGLWEAVILWPLFWGAILLFLLLCSN